MSYQTIDQLRRLAQRVLDVRKTRRLFAGSQTEGDLALAAAHRRDQVIAKLNRLHPEWKRYVCARLDMADDLA